jgi:hypothetical protein
VTGEPTREQARDAAREELSRRQYEDAQPSLAVRLLGRLLREIGELLDRAAGAAPGGALGLVLLVALLVLLVAVVLAKVRPSARSAGGQALFAGAGTLTAAEHRARAEQAAAQGQFAEAVRERLRAVVRELEQRGLLDHRPGRTAEEVAREAGALVPDAAADLSRAARVFAEVWYGGRPAEAGSYAVVVDVDTRLAERRLAVR